VTDDETRHFARERGLQASWRDYRGDTHEVPVDILRALLHALGPPPARTGPPPLVTAEAAESITLPGAPGRYRIRLEDGTAIEGAAEDAGEGRVVLPPVDRAGYHALELNGAERIIAAAPPRCWTVADAAGDPKPWGLAVQLYGLHRPHDGGLGDFAALNNLVRHAGAAGADAIAISPVHAQFSADPGRFSPYAPSSRALLNAIFARIDSPAAVDHGVFVDWPHATALRLAGLRALFDEVMTDASTAPRDAFEVFWRERGAMLDRHAIFEALHAVQFGADPTRWHWRDWPEGLQHPASPDVAAFAAEHREEIAFHAFAQYRADHDLRAAHHAAREAGMKLGLITDLAVGVDSGGSDVWTRPEEMLGGLTIGAPPDLINLQGQNWGVTSFAPDGLAAHGFGAFLEMLRAALRHAGGVRIDHVMGLARLWVIPRGAAADQGAYLRFPLTDLLRLVRLESQRHRAIVLGEDLGTLPDGFRELLERAGVGGLRVTWFERDGDVFRSPRHWSPDAVAMTTTHDLPTTLGWWQYRDIAWRERLGLSSDDARPARAHDRTMLWRAFCESGAGAGDMPGDNDTRIVDAACDHIGRAACALALLPLEDALALEEQPNLPGTTDEHPNWRRRLPAPAESLLAEPAAAARLARLADARKHA